MEDNNLNTTSSMPAPAPQNTNNTIVSKTKTSKKLPKKLLLLVLVVLLVGAAIYGTYYQTDKKTHNKITELESKLQKSDEQLKSAQAEVADYKEGTGENKIERNGFQSVFLKSGSVYFGKITKITQTQIDLEDIYYLKTQPSSTDIDKVQDLSLAKLGNELHGPEDKMIIERQNVDFWENLKEDGQVVKAIREYEKANPN